MLRLSRLVHQPGQVSHRQAMSEFARRASLLKRRFRGRGQYEFARTEAQRFLDAEVPKSNVNGWMENSSNAVALSQVLRFFEVQPDATLSSLLLNTLVRTAEDSSVDPSTRLEAVLSLISMRPEENYERAFSTVENVLKHTARPRDAAGSGGGTRAGELWGVLDLSAKVLQRCGKRVPTALSDRLTNAVMAQLHATDAKDMPALQSSLLRIYSWMVRAEREEARHLLFTLVTHTGDFIGYNYSTLMLSCWRHHLLHPLPVDLIQKLARTGLQYCTVANGRDAAAIVSTIARMLGTLEVGENGVELRDRSELQNRFNALLEDYRPRVLRFMDEADKLYWSHSEDVTSVVFAYELGGHLRYRAVFEAYAVYVGREVSRFEPTQLAMATGILRRAQLLTPPLAAKLSERIEVVLGELKLAELSHICATFATLARRPAWMPEAKAVVLRLPSTEASGLTLLNLALAFPDDDGFVARVPYDKLSARQLVDTLPLVLGSGKFEMPVVAALLTRLNDPAERISPDDVRVLLSSNRPQLVTAVYSYLARRFAEPEWDADTLYYLPLAVPSGQFGPAARDPAKALAAAQTASISPEQFVSLVELLLAVFGDSDAGIAEFVRTGGLDLVSADKVLERTAVRYLAAVRAVPAVRPTEQWLSVFAEKLGTHLRSLKPEELESLLVSLHTVYGDVSRTPALQTVLSEVVESCYPRFTQADAQTARLTVLLVYLQRGMSFPLLTDEAEMVKQVKAAAGSLPNDVQDAVAAMPLPSAATPPSQTRVGRFTLKQVKPRDTEAEDGVLAGDLPELDLNMGSDPFASPLAASPPPAQPQASVPAPTPAESSSQSQPVDAHSSASAEQRNAKPADESAAAALTQSHKPHGGKERQTSYYTKFFNSSVGQLFMGKGFENEDDVPQNHAGGAQHPQPSPQLPTSSQPPTPSPPAEPPRPRRTNLSPSAAAAAPARPAAASEEPAAAPPHVPAHVEEAPVPGSFFANWGTPPTFLGSVAAPPPLPQQQQQQQPSPSSNPWGAGEVAAPFAPSTSSPYGIPSATQNNALFSSLFENNSGSNSASPPPPPPQEQQQQQQQQQHPSTAFSSIFNEASTNGNLQMPPGAADPTARAPLIRPARPVITRKAAITRAGPTAAAGSPATLSSPPPTQQQQQNPTATRGGANGMYEDINKIYKDPLAAAQGRPGAARAGEAEIVLDAPAATATGVRADGAAGFMSKVGLAKISGYNMDSTDNGEPAAPAFHQPPPPQQQQQPGRAVMTAAVAKERPLAWQEAARQVGRVSRYGKTKTRTRTQQSLSEWLSAPAKKLSDSVGAGAASAAGEGSASAAERGTSPTAAAAAAAGRGGRGKGKKAAKAAAEEEDTTAAAAAPATSRGRGRSAQGSTPYAAAAAAAATKSGRKAAPAAAAGRKSAAKPKPKAATKAKKPKPTPKAAKAAPKVKPKKAPASPKKPAAKKAPAAPKKPAAKKAAKGKKK